MHAIRKLSVTEHPRPFENTVFPKTNTWKRMWGYFKAWAFKTYSIQAFIDHAFYLRYLRYLVIGQKQNFLGANGNSHPKRFSESSIVPSFLFGEAEKWKIPSRNLGERTRQVWRDNSRRVRTHEKNSGDAVRWLGTIIQRFFCAQSGAGIRLNFWKWFGKSRYPGALSPVLENFRRAYSLDPTDCPWVSEDAELSERKILKWSKAFNAVNEYVGTFWDMIKVCNNGKTKQRRIQRQHNYM